MAPVIALFAVGLPKSACGPVSSSESRNCTQRCPSELSTLCDAHKDVPAALLGFEEDSLWIPRLDEFNSCTGSRISLTYTLLGEDGMADALEADCGTVAPTPSEGAGIYDGYVVQAPWVPNVEPLLENLSPRIAATPEIDWLDINPTSRSIVSFSNTARWPVPPYPCFPPTHAECQAHESRQVRALPLDVDFIAIGWREDVFRQWQPELEAMGLWPGPPRIPAGSSALLPYMRIIDSASGCRPARDARGAGRRLRVSQGQGPQRRRHRRLGLLPHAAAKLLHGLSGAADDEKRAGVCIRGLQRGPDRPEPLLRRAELRDDGRQRRLHAGAMPLPAPPRTDPLKICR